MDYEAVIAAPFAHLGIRVAGQALEGIDMLPRQVALKPARDPLAVDAAAQLQAYLENPRFRFELPLKEQGTPFQRRVWELLRAIAPGEVLTYGALARRLSSSPRAVGNACRANPLPIVTPCHRVVARQGIGGFAGRVAGPELARKRWLLDHEGVAL